MSASESGGGFRTVLVNWGPTLLFNVVAPLLTYQLLVDHMSGVYALLLSGLWPAAEVAVFYAIRRRIDDFGMLTLMFLALSVVAAALFHSERMLLLKESAITAVFGLICLATLAAPRPLMFYFGRKFATDGTEAGVAYWNSMWQYEGFRGTQRMLTTVWGVVYLVEAAVRVALTFVLSRGAAVTMNNIVPYVVLGGLLYWTISLGKKRRAAALAAGRLSALGPVPEQGATAPANAPANPATSTAPEAV
ncbi:hypothetical protein GCM10023205_38660 [Yinghuangia aomiensis]|uniref:Intracellular septation protein A n=1 Tax=Yinghuangia aomiensis TaxID=676205 RepID=A0ABP9HFL2_9ACTN